MDFYFIKAVNEFEALENEWNALLAESISDVPFLRHEYLHTWWETRGGGEWDNIELSIVTARRDGRLIGIAPFFRKIEASGKSTLMLLSSIEISDYLDLIVREIDLQEFTARLFDFLAEKVEIPWNSMDLANLPEDSASLAALQSAANEQGWNFTKEQFSPVIPVTLPGDFEVYLSGIDKKQRHEIRRKMRRAAEFDLPVTWYILDDKTLLEDEIQAFLTLMENDQDKATFLNPSMRLQMVNSMQVAWNAGWLQLAFLEVDGQKAAGYLNFDYNDRIWVYNSGLDPRYLDLSPGWVLLGHLLQWANENKRSVFDFMRGDEAYKFKFGGEKQFVVRFKVQR